MRTNSDLCHLHHELIGFYNRDEKCLQRGTNWVFKLKRSACIYAPGGIRTRNPSERIAADLRLRRRGQLDRLPTSYT